jgi:hypothetical protein
MTGGGQRAEGLQHMRTVARLALFNLVIRFRPLDSRNNPISFEYSIMSIDSLPLHDAFLTAIGLEGGVLHLSFENDGNKSEIKMEGVVGLIVNNFLAGNIVFSAEIHDLPINKISQADNKDIIEKYCIFYKSPCIDSAKGRALFITSSYGAELMVVFDGDCIQTNCEADAGVKSDNS